MILPVVHLNAFAGRKTVKVEMETNMLISKELNEAMNKQIGSELGASNQYIKIASFFENENLPELSGFFFRQSDEERVHAMKFVHYILEAGGEVNIPQIAAAPAGIKSAEEALQMALDWEMEVTKQINGLMDLAIKQGDHIAQNFLRWFVDEQLEEVSTMDQMLGVVKRAGDQLLFVEQYVQRLGDPHAGGEAAA
jgi:bacterioferritin B